MASKDFCALTKPRKVRMGASSRLDDPKFVNKLLMAAASGMSRRGVAAAVGIPHDQLFRWLGRGRAAPDDDRYGAFEQQFTAAERVPEAAAANALSREVQRINKCALRDEELKHHERVFLQGYLAQKYPGEWGVGSASGRALDAEPDGAAYLQEKGLQDHQLREMIREPPEDIAAALLSEADSVVLRLVEAGWRPDAELFERLGSSPHGVPEWADDIKDI